MYRRIHCSNSSPIVELSVKFVSQICHENINKALDGTYLADFGIYVTVKVDTPLVSKLTDTVLVSFETNGYRFS